MRAPRDIVVNRAAAEAIRRGHPWVWKNAVLRGLGSTAAGDEVQVAAEDGAALGRGIVDPESPIAVRMWTPGKSPIDRTLLTARIASALRVRRVLVEGARTTAYRMIHGEGDRCPGFVVDRYGDIAVLRVDGDGARAFLETFAGALWPELERAGVRSLVHREAAAQGGDAERTTLHGENPPDVVEVMEHGVPFVVDLAHGQKTGAFLDQRENRRRVGELARGRRVLNLFSYAGGFSLRAALGGATHVVSVDSAAKAHVTAQASFRLAGVDARAHDFVTADVFAFLSESKRRGRTWDLVVSDPPSFAPNEKARTRALTAYRGLHRACVEVLADGALFCAASCSSHVDADAFATTLDDAALGPTSLRLLETHGPPADHPTLPAWPEGRYLKFFVLG